MKKFILVLVVLFALAGVVNAAVEVKSAGTVVGKTETINLSTGLAAVQNGTDIDVTVSGTQSLGAVTATSAVIDGTIYTATLDVDGGLYLGRATVDPCATLGPGHIFINNTTGAPCFCNNLGVDLSLYNGTSDCF